MGWILACPCLKTPNNSLKFFPSTFSRQILTAPTWDYDLHLQPATFNLIFAFAALHHIPGHDQRQRILQKARSLLALDGKLIHSEWQFLNSEKLTARIQPWERVNLSTADVDLGDTLLDWRSDGNGLRYVHHFSEQELLDLASVSGFKVVESFLSDGANGRLGLYQTWEGV